MFFDTIRLQSISAFNAPSKSASTYSYISPIFIQRNLNTNPLPKTNKRGFINFNASAYENPIPITNNIFKKDEFQKKTNLLKQRFYSRFISTLLDFDDNKDKFFKVSLTAEQIKNWETWISNVSDDASFKPPQFDKKDVVNDDVETTAFDNLVKKAEQGVLPTEDNYKQIREDLFKKTKESGRFKG